jgi:GNAT superfamily N-acetyltransferase
MDSDALARAADRTLAFAWAALGRNGGFPVVAGPSMTLFASGTPFAFFNGAIATAPATDPDAVVRQVLAFFASTDVPYLMSVRDGSDDALLAAGRAAGLKDAGGALLQVLNPITSAPAPPRLLDVVLATEDTDLQTHRDLAAACFGMPVDVAQRLYGDGCLDDPDLAIVIGRVDSVPVATAMLVRSDRTAGVYNVVTVPAHRGKGYGAAVTWAVVAEGARRGCTTAVLQASESGYPVYRRMGFVDGGWYVELAGPPEG